MFGNKLRGLLLDATTSCNALCSQCARTGIDLKPSNISLGMIKSIMESKYLSELQNVQLNGIFGDICAHPQSYEIIEYLNNMDMPSLELIHVCTNGSLQNKSYWNKLGKMKKVVTKFAIDGLEDTNEIYRVGCDFNKIMENTKSYIDAGGHAQWQFIGFEHNEHQYEEVIERARSMGFKEFETWKTNRVSGDLKQPKNKKLASSLANEGVKEKNIVCHAEKNNQMWIDHKGNVFPCCWVCTDNHFIKNTEKERFHSYIDFDVNLNNRSFDEIYEDYLENEEHLKMIMTSGVISPCVQMCGRNIQSDQEQIKL